MTLPLAARAGFVWLDTGTRRVGAAATTALAIDAGAPARAGGDFTLRGSARGEAAGSVPSVNVSAPPSVDGRSSENLMALGLGVGSGETCTACTFRGRLTPQD